jgi:virginiamycin A acetyltransferase
MLNIISNTITFLKALFVTPSVDWSANVRYKKECEIDKSVKIYGNYSLYRVKIKFGTYVARNASISFTEIGKFCSIGPNFSCGFGIHPVSGISTSPIFYSTKKQCGFTFSKCDKIEERKLVEIGNDVFIGINVTVLDGVKIGDGAVIGAGAVVSKDIPPYAIAVGCPIRIIKYRFDKEIIERLLLTKWWDQDIKVFQKIEANYFDVWQFLNEMESTNIRINQD